MKQYNQSPASESRVIPSDPHASRQASLTDILAQRSHSPVVQLMDPDGSVGVAKGFPIINDIWTFLGGNMELWNWCLSVTDQNEKMTRTLYKVLKPKPVEYEKYTEFVQSVGVDIFCELVNEGINILDVWMKCGVNVLVPFRTKYREYAEFITLVSNDFLKEFVKRKEEIDPWLKFYFEHKDKLTIELFISLWNKRKEDRSNFFGLLESREDDFLQLCELGSSCDRLDCFKTLLIGGTWEIGDLLSLVKVFHDKEFTDSEIAPFMNLIPELQFNEVLTFLKLGDWNKRQRFRLLDDFIKREKPKEFSFFISLMGKIIAKCDKGIVNDFLFLLGKEWTWPCIIELATSYDKLTEEVKKVFRDLAVKLRGRTPQEVVDFALLENWRGEFLLELAQKDVDYHEKIEHKEWVRFASLGPNRVNDIEKFLALEKWEVNDIYSIAEICFEHNKNVETCISLMKTLTEKCDASIRPIKDWYLLAEKVENVDCVTKLVKLDKNWTTTFLLNEVPILWFSSSVTIDSLVSILQCDRYLGQVDVIKNLLKLAEQIETIDYVSTFAVTFANYSDCVKAIREYGILESVISLIKECGFTFDVMSEILVNLSIKIHNKLRIAQILTQIITSKLKFEIVKQLLDTNLNWTVICKYLPYFQCEAAISAAEDLSFNCFVGNQRMKIYARPDLIQHLQEKHTFKYFLMTKENCKRSSCTIAFFNMNQCEYTQLKEIVETKVSGQISNTLLEIAIGKFGSIVILGYKVGFTNTGNGFRIDQFYPVNIAYKDLSGDNLVAIGMLLNKIDSF